MASFDSIMNIVIPAGLIIGMALLIYFKIFEPMMHDQLQSFYAWMSGKSQKDDDPTRRIIVYD